MNRDKCKRFKDRSNDLIARINDLFGASSLEKSKLEPLKVSLDAILEEINSLTDNDFKRGDNEK